MRRVPDTGAVVKVGENNGFIQLGQTLRVNCCPREVDTESKEVSSFSLSELQWCRDAQRTDTTKESHKQVDPPTGTPATLAAVRVKLPPFWLANPEVWFAQAEVQFTCRGNNSIIKFVCISLVRYNGSKRYSGAGRR